VRPTSVGTFVLCVAMVSGQSIAAQEVTKPSVRMERRAGTAAATSSPAEQVDRSVVVRPDETDARDTRDRLVKLLRQYPPTLVQVLRADPSLLKNDAYLAPYPGLAGFLGQHPEVAHNPAYFVGDPWVFRENNALGDKLRFIDQTMAGIALLLGFLALIGVLAWLLKAFIDNRRWLSVSRVQSDLHMKLIDRFTSNEDLLAYIQTPGGRRFLEAVPIPLDAAPRATGAPVNRILWSIQAGLVAGLTGAGLLYSSAHLGASGGDLADISSLLFVVGMIGLAVGTGFVLSAAAAYFLSRRLGLFEPPVMAPHA
jgi:hypothetical protein